jgi:hypothetical protein
VRSALVGIGATAQNRRTVVLDLGEHLLLLDRDEHATTIAVGGPDPFTVATWLAQQLEDAGCKIEGVLPPRVAPLV